MPKSWVAQSVGTGPLTAAILRSLGGKNFFFRGLGSRQLGPRTVPGCIGSNRAEAIERQPVPIYYDTESCAPLKAMHRTRISLPIPELGISPTAAFAAGQVHSGDLKCALGGRTLHACRLSGLIF